MRTKGPGMLLGFKAIALSEALTKSEKRVGAVLLDHYNHKSGQCDPSYGTLSDLVGLHRRTIIRIIDGLVAASLFLKIRHGGNFHRNLYKPNWMEFRRREAEWQMKRQRRAEHRRAQKMSPSRCARSHLAGDTADVTQTFPTKPISFETCQVDSRTKQGGDANTCPSRIKNANSTIATTSQGLVRRFHVKPPRSADAARDSAQRRWSEQLTRLLQDNEGLHAQVLAAIDPTLSEAATDAELKCRGAGFQRIVDELQAREIAIPSADGDAP